MFSVSFPKILKQLFYRILLDDSFCKYLWKGLFCGTFVGGRPAVLLKIKFSWVFFKLLAYILHNFRQITKFSQYLFYIATLEGGSRTTAPEENYPPTPKLTLTQTLILTLEGGRRAQFSSGAIVWLPPILKLTLTLTQTPVLTGGQFSSGAIVRIPLKTISEYHPLKTLKLIESALQYML